MNETNLCTDGYVPPVVLHGRVQERGVSSSPRAGEDLQHRREPVADRTDYRFVRLGIPVELV